VYTIVLLGAAVDTFDRIGIILAVVVFGAIGIYIGYRNGKGWQAKKRQEREAPPDATHDED
jgi:hypothetical protein